MRIIVAQFIETIQNSRPFKATREKAYFVAIASLEDNPRVRQILRHLDILNTKAAALLTHISLMIAVTAFIFYFLYDGAALDIFGTVILVEMVLYILLTIPALAPLYVTNFYSIKGDLGTEELALRFYSRRRNTFYLAYFGCIGLTLIFGLTVGSKVIWDIVNDQAIVGGGSALESRVEDKLGYEWSGNGSEG